MPGPDPVRLLGPKGPHPYSCIMRWMGPQSSPSTGSSCTPALPSVTHALPIMMRSRERPVACPRSMCSLSSQDTLTLTSAQERAPNPSGILFQASRNSWLLVLSGLQCLGQTVWWFERSSSSCRLGAGAGEQSAPSTHGIGETFGRRWIKVRPRNTGLENLWQVMQGGVSMRHTCRQVEGLKTGPPLARTRCYIADPESYQGRCTALDARWN